MLARTYRMIAQGGRILSTRQMAETIEAYFKRIGESMSGVADLAAHHSEWVRAAGPTIAAPPSRARRDTPGIATLQMLNMLEHFDMRGAG